MPTTADGRFNAWRRTDMVQVGVRLAPDVGQGDLRDGGKAERLLPLVVRDDARTARILLCPGDTVALLDGEDQINDRLGDCQQ